MSHIFQINFKNKKDCFKIKYKNPFQYKMLFINIYINYIYYYI